MEFLPSKGKFFTVHFDLQIKDRDPLVRLTVSNMYEQYKVYILDHFLNIY